MKKTCMNCIYYCGCLADDTFNYHVHDYCQRWGKSLTNNFSSELNKDLCELCNFTDQLCVYNDVDIGEACCYLFRQRNPVTDEDFFKKNKQYNLETLQKCIEELLDRYDEENEDNNPFSKESLLELKKKYEQIEKGE